MQSLFIVFILFFILPAPTGGVCNTFNEEMTSSAEFSIMGQLSIDDDNIHFGHHTLLFALRFDDIPEDASNVRLQLEVEEVLKPGYLTVLVLGERSSSPKPFEQYENLLNRPRTTHSVLWSNSFSSEGEVFVSPVSNIVDEVTSHPDFDGSVVLIIQIIIGSGNAIVAPSLIFDSCETELTDCSSVNFCCGTEFDGQYTSAQGQQVNGAMLWTRDDGDFAIWRESFTSMSGADIAASEPRWVIGSTSNPDASLLVSPDTSSSLIFNSQWLRFDSMFDVDASPITVDCSVAWQGCDACEVLSDDDDISMFPSGFPSGSPTTTTGTPTRTPSLPPSPTDSDIALTITIEVCPTPSSSGTDQPFDFQLCDGSSNCEIYTYADILNPGETHIIDVPKDGFAESVESLKIGAPLSGDEVCLTVSASNAESSVETHETWLSMDCESNEGSCTDAVYVDFRGYSQPTHVPTIADETLDRDECSQTCQAFFDEFSLPSDTFSAIDLGFVYAPEKIDDFTASSEFQYKDDLYLSNGELFIQLPSGLYRRTCVGYSTSSQDACDSHSLYCAGGNTRGSPTQVLDEMLELRDQDMVHPHCPSGCQSISGVEAAFYQDSGITKPLCRFANAFHFIESDGSKRFTCVGAGSEIEPEYCPANYLICGTYVDGYPHYGSYNLKAELLRAASENPERRHPFCPQSTV